MNREEAKEICEIIETHGIEVIKAYGEGKVIQHLNLDGEWVDCDMPISFVNNHSFRVKPEENYTIKQNAGYNQIEGGVVSISGSVDTFKCWKCGRTLPVSERTNIVYASNPPRYSCKECEGIKKEKQFRQFKDCDELVKCWEKKMYIPAVKFTEDTRNKLYRPAVWVKHKEYGTDFLITAFDNNNESIGANVIINDMGVTMKMLFDNYTFCDGSVCGVIE